MAAALLQRGNSAATGRDRQFNDQAPSAAAPRMTELHNVGAVECFASGAMTENRRDTN